MFLKANDIQTIISLGFDQDKIPALEAYVDLLWKSNEELNLISRKMTEEELIQNHIIDCLLPLKHFPKDIKKVADLGTGGGLPAILYAIQFPQIKFELYEKSPLKQNFLNSCKKIAPNTNVHSFVTLDMPGVDLVIARGFKPLEVILDMNRTYFEKGGAYFLLKARLEKINEELTDAKKKFKGLKSEIVALKSPVLEVERHLVLINF